MCGVYRQRKSGSNGEVTASGPYDDFPSSWEAIRFRTQLPVAVRFSI